MTQCEGRLGDFWTIIEVEVEERVISIITEIIPVVHILFISSSHLNRFIGSGRRFEYADGADLQEEDSKLCEGTFGGPSPSTTPFRKRKSYQAIVLSTPTVIILKTKGLGCQVNLGTIP